MANQKQRSKAAQSPAAGRTGGARGTQKEGTRSDEIQPAPASAANPERHPAPPKRRKWLLVLSIVLLAAWMALLVYLALAT